MIGKMSERITFQAYSETSNGAGGFTKTWENLSSVPSVWAHVAPKRGIEAFLEDRVNASAMYVFTIRQRSDLNETMRIQWRGETYNIRSIMREGPRPMYMKIEAERGVSN